ncbi:MAG TPA: hypothetical protein PLI18_00345 [Pirellulaceae bacterium]|nr:hypothetical protein [Pirellulaceae bacterium]
MLYGRPASGKTCLLAALAMPREPHPDGHSCIWVCDSQTISPPSGSRESWDVNDPTVARFLGKEWLQRAIDAISAGELPRANPNDATPFRLLFDVTQTNGRVQRIEMIDYSGELVDPNLSDDVLARKLLNHLEMADGILVLAEAPRRDEPLYELYRELQILQQALALVNDRRRKTSADPIPIAMLLNKWDRFSKMEEFEKEIAQIEVQEFINQKPVVPQRALYSVLQSLAGSLHETPFSEIFPVSAFGRTRRESREIDGKVRELELPRDLAPLPSYGLEDPLVWISRRTDQLELHELEQRAGRLAFWKLWQLPSRTGAKVSRHAEELRRRMPSHLPEAQALSRVAERGNKAFRSQLTTLAALVLMTVVGTVQSAFVVHDSIRYAAAKSLERELDAGANPTSLITPLDESSGFLATYARPSWLRLASQILVASPDTAQDVHRRLLAAIEHANHLSAATNEFRIRCGSLAAEAEATPDPARVQELLEQLESMPLPTDPLLADLTGQIKENAAGRVRERMTRVETAVGTERLTAAYFADMREARLPEAVARLESGKIQFPAEVAQLQANFRNQWVSILHAKVVEHAKADRWDSIEQLLGRIRNDNGMAGLVGAREVTARVDQERSLVADWRADRAYARWFISPSLTSAQTETLEFGRDWQKRTVKEWLAYQQFLSTSHFWRLKINRFTTSNTGSLFDPTDYSLTAYHQENYIGSGSFSGPAGAADVTLYIDCNDVAGRPGDPLTFRFSARTTNWLVENISFQGELSGAAMSLTSESWVRIRTPADYPNPEIRVRLEPVGFTIPSEPQLPTAQDPDIR